MGGEGPRAGRGHGRGSWSHSRKGGRFPAHLPAETFESNRTPRQPRPQPTATLDARFPGNSVTLLEATASLTLTGVPFSPVSAGGRRLSGHRGPESKTATGALPRRLPSAEPRGPSSRERGCLPAGGQHLPQALCSRCGHHPRFLAA